MTYNSIIQRIFVVFYIYTYVCVYIKDYKNPLYDTVIGHESDNKIQSPVIIAAVQGGSLGVQRP